MSNDIRKWNIMDLKPHPRRSEFSDDLPCHLLQQLAQSMEEHGLMRPLEILPDGTIVCGHQRVRAAKHLGWKEIDVCVNHALAAQGNIAIEKRMIEDNEFRRMLEDDD